MSKEHSTRVYVGNLGGSGDKSELQREFSQFGHVKDVWVARNPPGFAFVEFEDYRDAEDAVRELDGRRVCGVRVRVEVSSHQGRSSRQQPPADRGRSRYGSDNRYNKGQKNYENYNDDSEDKFTRRSTHRRPERSPEMDRFQRRYSRSRSRSPPPRY